jgi:hypothetical protein
VKILSSSCFSQRGILLLALSVMSLAALHCSSKSDGPGSIALALSSVTATSITSTSAVITWSTNLSSTSTVQYGLTANYGNATPLYGLTLNHSVSLTGLEPGTLYHYSVTSADPTTSTASSSPDATFTTLLRDGGSGSADGGASSCSATGTALYQVNNGGPAVGTFAADELCTGGQTWGVTEAVTTASVANAAPAAVYQSYRYGTSSPMNPFSCTLGNLVSGAHYAVRLHFAEIYNTEAGERLFDVSANGTSLLSNFDVFVAAGGSFKAVTEDFDVIANATGSIELTFTPIAGKDSAEVSGMELYPSTCGDAGWGSGGPPPPDAGTTTTTPGPGTVTLITPTLYVSNGGSDSNSGKSSTTAFATIAHAATVAQAGDVVQVEAGTYNDEVLVQGNGTSSSPITFQANGTVLVQGIVQPQDWSGDGSTPSQNGNHYVTWNGFTFQPLNPIPLPGVQVSASTGWVFLNDTFQNGMIGLNIRGNYVTINHCLFQHNEGSNCHGFVGAGSDSDQLTGVQVLSSVWHDINTQRQANCGNSCVQKFLFSNGVVYDNNIAYNNGGPAIWFDTNNYNFVISHNTFRNNDLGPDMENNPSSNGQVYNNDFFGNGYAMNGTQTGGLAVFESQNVEAHHNAFQNNVFVSLVMREGSHPTMVANNYFHDNFLNDGNGYFGGWSAMGDTTPTTLNNRMNDDTFGPKVQGFILWGYSPQTTWSSLSQCQTIPEEQNGTLGSGIPAGVGNGGTP